MTKMEKYEANGKTVRICGKTNTSEAGHPTIVANRKVADVVEHKMIEIFKI